MNESTEENFTIRIMEKVPAEHLGVQDSYELFQDPDFPLTKEDVVWDSTRLALDVEHILAAVDSVEDERKCTWFSSELGSEWSLPRILDELEQDRVLAVPRERIAPGALEALPEGDFTALSFAYLMHIGALRIRSCNETQEDHQIIYDRRLTDGVPQFFSLLTRLIWMWRGYAEGPRDPEEYGDLEENEPIDDGFSVTLFRAEHTNATALMGEVDSPVLGAERDPVYKEIYYRPEVDLNGPDASVTPSSTAAQPAEPAGEPWLDDPAYLLSQISKRNLIFTNDCIERDGGKPVITGAIANDGWIATLSPDACDKFLTSGAQQFERILRVIEDDEGLVIPRELFPPRPNGKQSQGNFTGTHLVATLQNRGVFGIDGENDHYRVFFDSTYCMKHMPKFFTLAARLIWDARSVYERLAGKPLSITFISTDGQNPDRGKGIYRFEEPDVCSDVFGGWSAFREEFGTPLAGIQRNPKETQVKKTPATNFKNLLETL